MRKNLSLVEVFRQDRDTSPEQPVEPWAVMVLALGSTLTFVWIGFLLWAALQFLDWAFG